MEIDRLVASSRAAVLERNKGFLSLSLSPPPAPLSFYVDVNILFICIYVNEDLLVGSGRAAGFERKKGSPLMGFT